MTGDRVIRIEVLADTCQVVIVGDGVEGTLILWRGRISSG
jgi:hypothetical protein